MHTVIILIKSVFHENYNHYYYNTKYNTINTIQNMLYYTRTELSEGIDVNYTSVSKKRIICHYLYFIDKGFSIQLAVCNGCHDI